jgi:flagellar biosynthesis GTPase FlhF
MQPERLIGTSIASVLEQARVSLGPDALILEVRKVSTPAGPRYLALAVRPGEGVESVADSPVPHPASDGTAERGSRGLVRSIRILSRAKQEPGGLAERIALVGPTGAGKTTTIAKLAHHQVAFGARRVGLLCLDTYRVGAIEQSRIHAKLAGLPIEVVYDPADLSPALHRLRDQEVLLIDTAGRGPLAQSDRYATRRLLDLLNPTEIHLVIPAGVRPSFGRRIVLEHRPLGVTHLLPTKMDECPDDDWVFRLAARESLPIRWVAGGHRVPDDLYDASVEGGWGPEGIGYRAAHGAARGTA